MAQKSSTRTTTKTYSGNHIMNTLAFAAVCFGGIALFISRILAWIGISSSICGALTTIANCLGWLVLSILSAKYIMHRRKIWLWVVWAIAVVMIIFGFVL